MSKMSKQGHPRARAGCRFGRGEDQRPRRARRPCPLRPITLPGCKVHARVRSTSHLSQRAATRHSPTPLLGIAQTIFSQGVLAREVRSSFSRSIEKHHLFHLFACVSWRFLSGRPCRSFGRRKRKQGQQSRDVTRVCAAPRGLVTTKCLVPQSLLPRACQDTALF